MQLTHTRNIMYSEQKRIIIRKYHYVKYEKNPSLQLSILTYLCK